MSVPYLLERMKKDFSLQIEIERTLARIQQLARVFDLPEVTHHFLILQLHSMIDFYRLFPLGQIGKKYLLFPTFNSRYNDKMKKNAVDVLCRSREDADCDLQRAWDFLG